MAGIGTKPSQLANPVPGQPSVQDLIAEFEAVGSMDKPAPAEAQMQAAAVGQTAQQEDISALISEFESGQAASVEQTGVVPPELMQEGELSDIGTRLQYSFATNKDEERGVLEKAFGLENVKEDKDGNLVFKKPGDKKWKRADSENFTLNDVIDLARPAAEIVGGGLGGLAAGTATLNPFVGGAAAGVAGQATGDALQGLLGVERRDRSALGDYALAGIGGGVLDSAVAGARYASRLVSGKKAVQEALKINPAALTDETKQIIAAEKVLNDAGISFGTLPNGKELRLAPQDFMADPELKKVAQMAGMVEGIDKIDAQRANAINLNLSEMLNTVSPGSGKALTEGVTYTPKDSGKRIVGAIKKAKADEGKIIGDYEKLAGNALNKTPIESPEVTQALSSFKQNLGIAEDGLTLMLGDEILNPKALTKEQLNGVTAKLGLSLAEANKAEEYMRVMSKLNQNNFNKAGKNTYADVKGAIEELQSLIKGTKPGDPFRRVLAQDLAQLREARNVMLEETLGEAAGTEFKAKLGKYAKISEGIRNIKTLSEGGSYSIRKISNDLFSGLKSKDQYESVKGLLTEYAPDVWQNLKDDVVQGALMEIKKNPDAVINAKTFAQQMNKYNPEVVSDLFKETGKDINVLNAMGKLTSKWDKQLKQTGQTLDAKQEASLVNLFNKLTNPIRTAMTFFSAITQRKAINELMGDNGIIRLINESKFTPEVKKTIIQQVQDLRDKQAAIKAAKEALKKAPARGLVPAGGMEAVDQTME